MRPEKCECGADVVYLHGQPWCAVTLAKYRLLHGEPRPPSQTTSKPNEAIADK